MPRKKAGEGIADTLGISKIKSGFVKAGNYLNQKSKDVSNTVRDYGDLVIHGRKDFPPKVRKVLEQHGNDPIVQMTINRIPVGKALTTALNVVSLGKFGDALKKSEYDKLFHLQLRLTTNNGTVLTIEKNEVINAEVNQKLQPKSEQQQMANPPEGTTLNSLMEGAKRIMGDKLIPYNAVSNNCQDFIMGVLTGSKLGNQTDTEFIKQYTAEFFSGDKHTGKVAKAVTDLGAKVNEITTGRGIHKGGEIQSIIFDRNEWTKVKSRNWCKKHGYKFDVDVKPEHWRYRQTEPDYKKYITKDMGHGVKLIIGFKGSSGKGVMDHEDIFKKIANVAMHVHNNRHNLDKHKLLDMYHALGHGIARSMQDMGESEMTGGKVNRLHKFHRWLGAVKDIGSYIKPVAEPILGALTSRAVSHISGNGAVPRGLLKEGRIKPAVMPREWQNEQLKLKVQKGEGFLDDLKSITKKVLPYATTYATGNPITGAILNQLGQKALGNGVAGKGGRGSGRFKKGSPEAKAWAVKMREARTRKQGYLKNVK